jgi:hypothetical protein
VTALVIDFKPESRQLRPSSKFEASGPDEAKRMVAWFRAAYTAV